MRNHIGKKVGTVEVTTALSKYVLDVRLSLGTSQFTVLVPLTPGGVVDPEKRDTYEEVRGTDLRVVKGEVERRLKGLDTTTFSDVIEYRCEDGESGYVGFDFRVARVSDATGPDGRPRLEVVVEVSGDGEVVVGVDTEGRPYPLQKYHGYNMADRMPFTVERFVRCTRIRGGIENMRRVLDDVFRGTESGVVERFDHSSLPGDLLVVFPGRP